MMRVPPTLFVPLLSLLAFAPSCWAEVRTETIEYSYDGQQMRGYLAWDDAVQGKRPGILVVHEWWGLNDYVKNRAKMLAELGYVAFAADLYGEGRVTTHPKQAGEWAEQVRANVEDWRKRALAGLDVLRQQQVTDSAHIAAIGYCFGGSTVMQIAYTGADLDGVVSFHGLLPVPTEEQARNVKAKILVAHGSEDKMMPPERIRELQTALDKAGVDWNMVIHGGAWHGFTNPNAGQYGVDALRYDPKADARSWADMKMFFDELFVHDSRP